MTIVSPSFASTATPTRSSVAATTTTTTTDTASDGSTTKSADKWTGLDKRRKEGYRRELDSIFDEDMSELEERQVIKRKGSDGEMEEQEWEEKGGAMSHFVVLDGTRMIDQKYPPGPHENKLIMKGRYRKAFLSEANKGRLMVFGPVAVISWGREIRRQRREKIDIQKGVDFYNEMREEYFNVTKESLQEQAAAEAALEDDEDDDDEEWDGEEYEEDEDGEYEYEYEDEEEE